MVVHTCTCIILVDKLGRKNHKSAIDVQLVNSSCTYVPLRRLSGLCENVAVSKCQQLFSQKKTRVKGDMDTLGECVLVCVIWYASIRARYISGVQLRYVRNIKER